MKTFTVPSYVQYSTGVADYIDSLGLSGNGIILTKSMNTNAKGYHFVCAKIANGKVVRNMYYVRLNGAVANMETRAYNSSNDARLESGAVLAFIPVETDW